MDSFNHPTSNLCGLLEPRREKVYYQHIPLHKSQLHNEVDGERESEWAGELTGSLLESFMVQFKVSKSDAFAPSPGGYYEFDIVRSVDFVVERGCDG